MQCESLVSFNPGCKKSIKRPLLFSRFSILYSIMCQASICFVAVLRISGVNEPGSERASRVSESVRKIGTNVLLYAFAIMQKNEWREKSAERHWKSAAGGIICERVNERVRKWDRERGREWGECGKKRGKKPNTFKKSYNFVMVFFLSTSSPLLLTRKFL